MATCESRLLRVASAAPGSCAASCTISPTLDRPGGPDPRDHVIGNTADDVTLHGLRVCPDLDTVMYTLGGGIHEEQGWGRADETSPSPRSWPPTAPSPQWFTLGDRDIATHVVRTRMIGQGLTLLRRSPRRSVSAGNPACGCCR